MRPLVRIITPLLAATTLLTANVMAQSRGADTIAFTVPYSAGGSADTLARQLGEIIRKQSGTVLVIENQGGAGGTIGAATVARARADDRRVMLASTSALTISPNLRPVSYDPIKDFTPIRGVAVGPIAMLASKSAPFKDFKGMLEYAQANPQAIRYGTPGPGSVAHLAMEELQLRAKVSLTHVPYKGESPAIQDALGGVTELLVVNTPTVIPHVKVGTLHPLAVFEPKRMQVWPDVPTLAEVGYEKLEYNSDFGIFAPASMPQEQRDKVSAMFSNAVASDEFKQALDKLSLLPSPIEGAQYAAKIAEENTRNAEIIKVRNIAAE